MKHGETLIRVRYAETDQMGVVYYANYLAWLEVGRTEYFRELGMPYSEVEKNDILLPVTKAFCQYKSPARYDDEVRVVTSIASLQEVRILFKYELFRRQTNELLAIGETEHAFVNRQGRPVVLKKYNPFLWKRLQEASGEHAE
ncbi:acyl-CoA thioesterase [Dethiobacter alkaliphilus]|uniref:Thioesterase superfamily protein n=1 Tax=Dethiobacter alkaliphilus AHT 1 TaxID=555088 RepID=C0GHD4_DETAL|nr:thioesterase family protein [Dethiobacter alkaliphilus]EEG77140.1 thioesterase superfamily protein [Dethiobacter alkaliphilus AHT 1]